MSRLNEFSSSCFIEEQPPLYSQPDEYTLGFVGLQSEGGTFHHDGAAGEPSFDVYGGKVEVRQRLLVFRHRAAETFFHRIEPSKMVSVHLYAAAGAPPPAKVWGKPWGGPCPRLRTASEKKPWWRSVSGVVMAGKWPFLMVAMAFCASTLHSLSSFLW